MGQRRLDRGPRGPHRGPGGGRHGLPLRRVRPPQAPKPLPPFQVFTGTDDLIPSPSRPHTPIQVSGEIVLNDDHPQLSPRVPACGEETLAPSTPDSTP